LIALAERAVKLDSSEILNAMDVTLSNLCLFIPEYRKTMFNEYLGEIDLASQAIYVMARELSNRVGEKPSVKPARQSRRY
jgi:hypothetical protein